MFLSIHGHYRDEEQSRKETIKHALRVAELSGVDAVFDMPNPERPVTSRNRVLERFELAKACNSRVFYGIYIGLTSDEKQIREAVETYREFFPKPGDRVGVVGVKLFAGKSVGDLEVIEEANQQAVYRWLAKYGFDGVSANHCEKESLMHPKLWNPEKPISHCRARPPEAELVSVKDIVQFASAVDFRGVVHICHVSDPGTVDYIDSIRRNLAGGEYGMLKITCGATPHHLFYNDSMMNSENGLLWKVNPPLRTKKSQKRLLEQLGDGKINCVELDHAPHTLPEKTGFPGKDGKPQYLSGIPGEHIWNRVIAKLKQRGFSEKQIQDLTFNNPLKIFGLEGVINSDIVPSPGYTGEGEYISSPY